MAQEVHVMSAKTVDGVKAEVAKRLADGWQLLIAYGLGTKEHVLIFVRQRQTGAAAVGVLIVFGAAGLADLVEHGREARSTTMARATA